MTKKGRPGSVAGAAARAALALAVTALGAPSAWAKPEFPGQLAQDRDVPCAPVCTVCHLVNPGTKGTAQRAFASRMMFMGLMDRGADKAFAALKLSQVASDQEMVERLEAGNDPNSPPSAKLLACGPQYGCGARIAKATPSNDASIATVMAGLSAFALSRRLKRRGANATRPHGAERC